jgi:hypothetical protein
MLLKKSYRRLFKRNLYATASEARATMDAVGAEIAALQDQKTAAVVEVLSRNLQQSKIASSDATSFAGWNAYKMSMDSALSMVLIKNKSGLSLETTVVPPSQPYFLTALGAVGMLCFSLLLHWQYRDGSRLQTT